MWSCFRVWHFVGVAIATYVRRYVGQYQTKKRAMTTGGGNTISWWGEATLHTGGPGGGGGLNVHVTCAYMSLTGGTCANVLLPAPAVRDMTYQFTSIFCAFVAAVNF